MGPRTVWTFRRRENPRIVAAVNYFQWKFATKPVQNIFSALNSIHDVRKILILPLRRDVGFQNSVFLHEFLLQKYLTHICTNFFLITGVTNFIDIFDKYTDVVWAGIAQSVYSDSLRAGRSGDRIPVGERFSAPVQAGPRTPQPPVQWVSGLSRV